MTMKPSSMNSPLLKRALRCMLAGCVIAPIAACSGSSGAPSASGGSGIVKIGNPYRIGDRTYYPSHEPAYEEVGVASWYGPGFHGKSTANGERFDQHALTAAHRTLPMPSIVEVTNLENGRSAILTVNDRGPFSKERIIDLSKASADRLGVIANGTAKVRVRYLPEESSRFLEQSIASGRLKADQKTLAALGAHSGERAQVASSGGNTSSFQLVSSAYADEPGSAASGGISSEAPLAPVQVRELAAPTAAPSVATQPPLVRSTPVVATQPQPVNIPGQGHAFVQVGSFSQSGNADQLVQKLASIGQASIKPVEISGRTWYRVRLGPVADDGAHEMLLAVRDMGIADAKIIRE